MKVRGYRVELEGVEAAIAGLPGVEEAVVAVTPGPPDEAVLVAAVVPAPGVVLDVDALRRGLAALLPAHAVPVRFEELGPFARTSGGKIDRRLVRAALGRDPQ